MDILIGLFLLIFGLTIAFMGTTLFFLVLPMIGFLFGFFTGAAVFQEIFGDGFLSSVSSWAAGLVLGLVFGFLAYFWWYAGVLLAAGALGALLGSGLAEAIGIDSGTLTFLFGLVGFIVFASVTYVFNLPIYLVIASSGILGGNLAVVGVMLVFNRVNTDELSHGTAAAVIEESWFWTVAVLVLAVIGAAYQLTVRDQLRVPQEKWVSITSS